MCCNQELFPFFMFKKLVYKGRFYLFQTYRFIHLYLHLFSFVNMIIPPTLQKSRIFLKKRLNDSYIEKS